MPGQLRCTTQALFIVVVALHINACSQSTPTEVKTSVETVDEFVARKAAEGMDLSRESGAIYWLHETHITHDTELLAQRASQKTAKWRTDLVAEARMFDGQDMSPQTARVLDLIKRRARQPAPDNADKRRELATITTEMIGIYGQGKWCPTEDNCIPGSELEARMGTSRDPDELLAMWQGWREIAVPMKPKYQRFVEIVNEGASERGYNDLGEAWRSNYDMSAAEFEAETLRLWRQVKPLYDELHCHVRATLSDHYGVEVVPPDGPIPAHVLGNMWGQAWNRVYDLLEPYPGVAQVNVTPTLVEEQWSAQQMVRSAESFYTSMGFEPLPDTFWERSQFTRPRDREVQCHASAWGLDSGKDLRIKMCINPTHQDLEVIYHELGHNFYQRAYNQQQWFLQSGAHGGFHEAIGDTVVLAMTPQYLREVGLLKSAAGSQEMIINDQMQRALSGIAMLPWAKLVDEWRWGVFSGDITPDNFNQAWWDLRLRYQGIASPVARGEDHFDPGAKYHIPANTPYSQYFLAQVLQFQFYRALCEASGHTGPLSQCSFYGNKEAGDRFQVMMAAGQSQPWQDTLRELTGSRDMDASAIIEYFEPLMGWLGEQNQGRQCGW